jgi:trimeric autotransporter adhesin
MTTRLPGRLIVLSMALGLLCTLNPQLSTFAQGTAFTYQGRLNDGGNPASGYYDLRFALYDANVNGNQIANALTNAATSVSGGMFSAQLDFGSAPFIGNARWLDIAVRTNGNGAFTALTPRQQLTAAPYAIYAPTAGAAATAASASNFSGSLSGDVTGTQGATVVSSVGGQSAVNVAGGASAANAATATNTANAIVKRDGAGNFSAGTVTATFSGNGANVTGVNAISLNGLASANFWQTGGNNVAAGQFIGSTNNQPLEFWVNGARALRLEPNNSGKPNVIGGSSANAVGGGAASATIGGGDANSVSGYSGTVGGGSGNTSSGGWATIPGGVNNVASGNWSFAAGAGAQATNRGAFVWADSFGPAFTSATNDQFSVRAQGGARFVTGGAGMTLDGQPVLTSQLTANDAYHSNIVNVVQGSPVNFAAPGVYGATIAGGGAANDGGFHYTNSVTADFGTVGGGANNAANGFGATVAGGYNNVASGYNATVPGGFQNYAAGDYSFAAGQQAQALHPGAFVWSDSQFGSFSSSTNDQFKVRAKGGVVFATGGAGLTLDGQPVVTSQSTANDQYHSNLVNVVEGSPVNFVAPGVYGATISGGGAAYYQAGPNSFGSTFYTNIVTGDFGTVGGGSENSSDNFATVGGGQDNTAGGSYGTVGGGLSNRANSPDATVAGGVQNTAIGTNSTVGGGVNNITSGIDATVSGGADNISSGTGAFIGGGGYDGHYKGNTASGAASVIGGGIGNRATNNYATVPGGDGNIAGGEFSFAAGSLAQALHQGAFVWADSQGTPFSSTSFDQFLIRAQGGVGIGTVSPQSALHVTSSSGDCEISVQGGATGSHRWTIQSSGAGSFLGTFQIIDRTAGAGGASRMLIDTSGHLGLGVNSVGSTHLIDTSSGAYLTTAGAWTSVSDRNVKEDFASIDPGQVLAKVAAMPITQWKYKVEPNGVKHIGPMAQDFHSAFGLGDSDKAICSIDEDGVALAAIQGLNQKLNEKDAEVQNLQRQNDLLAERLNQLEAAVNSLALKR